MNCEVTLATELFIAANPIVKIVLENCCWQNHIVKIVVENSKQKFRWGRNYTHDNSFYVILNANEVISAIFVVRLLKKTYFNEHMDRTSASGRANHSVHIYLSVPVAEPITAPTSIYQCQWRSQSQRPHLFISASGGANHSVHIYLSVPVVGTRCIKLEGEAD